MAIVGGDADLFAPDNPYRVEGDALAEILGVSTRQVRNYVKDGMPTLGRNAYDLRQSVQWWAETMKTPTKSTTELTARTRLAEAQRERVELDIEERRKKLISISEVAQVIDSIGTVISTQLDSFAPRNAAPLARETSPKLVQKMLFDECRLIRRAIAAETRKLAEVTSRKEEEAPAPKKKTRRKTRTKKTPEPSTEAEA